MEAWRYCSKCCSFGSLVNISNSIRSWTLGKILELLLHHAKFPAIDQCDNCHDKGDDESSQVFYCGGLIPKSILCIRRIKIKPCILRLPLLACGKAHGIRPVTEVNQENDIANAVATFNQLQAELTHQFCSNSIFKDIQELSKQRTDMNHLLQCESYGQVMLRNLMVSQESTNKFDKFIHENDIDGARRHTVQLCMHHNHVLQQINEVASVVLPDGKKRQLVPISIPYPDVHYFIGSEAKAHNVIVRDGEVTSIIAFALEMPEYVNTVNRHCRNREQCAEKHIELQFSDSSAQYYCKVYNAASFHVLRENLDIVESAYIASLSRCKRWTPKGGKSKAAFFRTADLAFCIKELTKVESESFTAFANCYCSYITNRVHTKCPSLFAKILGAYRVCFKNHITDHAIKLDCIVMENFPSTIQSDEQYLLFDLKGSKRNRLASTEDATVGVGLDDDFLKYIINDPIYLDLCNYTVLMNCIAADTKFLSQMLIMDYSLLVRIHYKHSSPSDHRHDGSTEINIDSARQISVCIVDYVRTFTWDKRMEMLIKKASAGLYLTQKPDTESSNMYKSTIPQYKYLDDSCSITKDEHTKPTEIDSIHPTIIDPIGYRQRFLRQMSDYFLILPTCTYDYEKERSMRDSFIQQSKDDMYARTIPKRIRYYYCLICITYLSI
ncbi:hypothetical protein GJ496_000965 [Pomphorhynchus laevis]|nr:hypothetical protein GJ496_000965 [Pomphorhynchus laevis]